MNEISINLQLTRPQCEALVGALDVACKAGGIRIAPICVWTAQELQRLLNEAVASQEVIPGPPDDQKAPAEPAS